MLQVIEDELRPPVANEARVRVLAAAVSLPERMAGLTMYGLASPSKRAILAECGATPIDYHTEDFATVIRPLEPDGSDAVSGIGGDYLSGGLSLLKRGGAG